jgi:hypothetical protein
MPLQKSVILSLERAILETLIFGKDAFNSLLENYSKEKQPLEKST